MAAGQEVTPPPGFVLDKPQPPPGFVLDSGARSTTAPAGPPANGDRTLAALISGVDPVTFMERLKGAASAVTNTLFPSGDVRNPKNTLPELTPEQDIGQKVVGAAGAIETGVGLASNLASKIPVPKSQNLADYFKERAGVNTARSLKPTTVETKAITQRIAPELSERGVSGLTGGQIDRQIESGFQEARARLHRVEDRVTSDPRPEYQIATRPIAKEITGAIDKLKVRGTRVSGHPDAIRALEGLREDILGLPEYADADQVIQLRRQYDQAIEEGGGYKESGTAAEKVAMRMKKGVADLLRGRINGLDSELASANHEYSLFSDARQVIRRRQLGDVGTTDAIPGVRGGILDDVMATWAGHAVGGTAGGAIMEAVNLGRQTRGWASLKASAQRAIAEGLQPPKPTPAGLLTTGTPQLTAPEMSHLEVVDAEKRIARDPKTGRMFKYWTSESQSK